MVALFVGWLLGIGTSLGAGLLCWAYVWGLDRNVRKQQEQIMAERTAASRIGTQGPIDKSVTYVPYDATRKKFDKMIRETPDI